MENGKINNTKPKGLRLLPTTRQKTKEKVNSWFMIMNGESGAEL